jgi:ribosomal protein L16 Arg81 hydroxylase
MLREPFFEDVIAPVSAHEFFAHYWEKTFLYNARDEPGRFNGLFSLGDVDRWLLATREGQPDSILITPPEGSQAWKRKHRPRDLAVDEAYELFAKGHSLVLNHLEDSWAPVAGLVSGLREAFCAEVGINVYVTPKGSQTFPVHTDDHDVFILQVQGEKIWRLHEMAQLSAERLQYRQDLCFTSDWGKSRVETPQIAELRLRPGNVLYIPRGMPHCAVARDELSLHLTISLRPLSWIDFFKAALEQASIHAPELRKSLPPGFFTGPTADEATHRAFVAALEAFQTHLSFEETHQVVSRSRVRALGFPPDGHFEQLASLPDLVLDSMLERRPGILCTVEISESNFAHIRFGGQHVRVPGRLREALEFIRDNPRFQVSQIPSLDDQSRLVLARRLVREGLLRFAELHASPEGLFTISGAGSLTTANR